MVSARKRTLSEALGNAVVQPPKEEQSMLHRIRNMWQFANLCQWICIFGRPLKIDAIKVESNTIDVFDLEAECLQPHSMVLQEIGLCILKFLSSHRGLDHTLFDEYTRRQYLAKDPGRNPFGVDEQPAKFADFDIFKKIRVLQQMTQFVMRHPERLRERMEEQKDSEQADWRIEPYGWDADDRTYFVLDDNRIYRLSEAPPPPPPPAPKPKKGTKAWRAAQRSARRRRVSAAAAAEAGDSGDEGSEREPEEEEEEEEEADGGLGGMKWECVAVTLDEVRDFLATIKTSKDPNEKVLRDSVQNHLVPILEKEEESRKAKMLKREKELMSLEKMAHAKRSSRLADKAEQHRADELAREEEQKRLAEEAAARREAQKRLKLEKERDLRLMSREKRLKEREARRLQHQEELAQLSEDSRNTGSASGRMSGRRLQAEIERRKEALRELEGEEDDWIFDCICGAYGQVDDGTHSVACEKCNVWQHSKCLGIKEEDAEKEDFHLVCAPCRRREKEALERPKHSIIKIKVPGTPSSPPVPRRESPSPRGPPSSNVYVEIQAKPPVPVPVSGHVRPAGTPTSNGTGTAGVNGHTPNGFHHQPSSVFEPPREQLDARIPIKGDTAAAAAAPPPPPARAAHQGPESPAAATSSTKPALNGPPPLNPFSSPHPDLSPPDQSPNKSRAYGTIHEQSSPVVRRTLQPLPTALNPPSILPPTPGGSFSLPEKLLLSPSKGSSDAPTTETSPPVPSPRGGLPTATSSIHAHTSHGGQPDGTAAPAPTTVVTPRLEPTRWQGGAEAGFEASSPLIPSSAGGKSPTKHSSPLPLQQRSVNGGPASPTPAILPPVAALTPSPRQQILTPPVKPGSHGQ